MHDSAIKQLEADVARIAERLVDIDQAVRLFLPAIEQMDHVADMSNRILAATAGDDGVPAWNATLAAISTLSEDVQRLAANVTYHTRELERVADMLATLKPLEAAVAGLAAQMFRVQEQVDTTLAPLHRRQFILTIAMLMLIVLLVLHTWQVTWQLETVSAVATAFLAGISLSR